MCARWPPVSTVTGLERSTAVLQYCVSVVLWYTVLCDSTAVSQRWKPSQRLHSFQEWIPHIWSSLVGWLPWLPATGFHSLIHFLSPRSSAPLWFVFFFLSPPVADFSTCFCFVFFFYGVVFVLFPAQSRPLHSCRPHNAVLFQWNPDVHTVLTVGV